MSTLIEPKNMHRVRVDEASRLKMQDSLRSAAEAMETPNDTMLRLFNGVSADCGMLQNKGVRIG
jgi:demethylsterigmatocystin 6-O-methyltransferase